MSILEKAEAMTARQEDTGFNHPAISVRSLSPEAYRMVVKFKHHMEQKQGGAFSYDKAVCALLDVLTNQAITNDKDND